MVDITHASLGASGFIDIDNKFLKFSYYAAAKDKTVTCKKGIVHVLTKKNKGTVVGVWSTEDGALTEREKLGGERYYRISKFIIDKSVYYDLQ